MSSKLFRTLVAALAAFALSGCCAHNLSSLDKELKQLYQQRTQAMASHQSPAAAEASLAALAKTAETDAGECKDMQPAFFRIAAVSAWQSDGAGAALVNPITTQGIAACDQLPAKDDGAPRDCTLIRIAAPMALQDELTVKQLEFTKQAEQAGGTLPATALPGERGLRDLLKGYSNASTQLVSIRSRVKALASRSRVKALASPTELLKQTDTQRLIVYCNARETFGLIGKVDGMTILALATERPPLDEIKTSLQGDGIDVSGVDACSPARLAQDPAFLTSP